MRLEDLKGQYPKTPDFISEMIEKEVEKQVHTQKNSRRSRKKKKVWTLGRTATAAAVACVLIGTGAYAAVNAYRNYHMNLQQQGSYSVVTGVTADTESQTTEVLPDQIADVKIETSYIPEGMEWKDERHLDYINTDNKGGFSIDSVLIGDGNLEKGLTDTSVEESEQTTFGEHEGVYLKYHTVQTDTHFNQRIYLLCPEEDRIVTMYIGSDVSKEEAYKVAEGITLTETGEMISTADMWDWNTLVENENAALAEGDGSELPAYDTVVPADRLHIYTMGEEIYKDPVLTEDTEGNQTAESKVSLSVDSVQVSDDFSLLNEVYIPDEWKDRLDENGKLKDNEATYVKCGDGVDTLDEVVRTENFPAKLVYAALTVTNHSDQDLENIHYYIKMSLLDQTDDGYQEKDYMNQSGEDYDYVQWDGGLNIDGGMQYYDSQSDIGKNYISSLAAGESTQVNVAWIVNEEDLGRMYLEVSGYGASLNSPNADPIQLVDVRQ